MKTVDFSETIAAIDLKSLEVLPGTLLPFGPIRSRHLIEFMKVCEY